MSAVKSFISCIYRKLVGSTRPKFRLLVFYYHLLKDIFGIIYFVYNYVRVGLLSPEIGGSMSNFHSVFKPDAGFIFIYLN